MRSRAIHTNQKEAIMAKSQTAPVTPEITTQPRPIAVIDLVGGTETYGTAQDIAPVRMVAARARTTYVKVSVKKKYDGGAVALGTEDGKWRWVSPDQLVALVKAEAEVPETPEQPAPETPAQPEVEPAQADDTPAEDAPAETEEAMKGKK